MFVDVPSRRHAHLRWVTPALVVTCVACYLWLMLSAPATRYAVLGNWGTVPAHLFQHGKVLEGWSWLRPLTSLFMHADWMHLLGNMLFLVIFGLPAERALGSRRFLALFLIGGAFANLVGAWTLSSQLRPIIGCSGAVSAMLGPHCSSACGCCCNCCSLGRARVSAPWCGGRTWPASASGSCSR